MCQHKEAVDWKVAHDNLVNLARRRSFHDFEEGRWLVVGLRELVHEHLGMGSYVEYLHRLFGYTPREARDRLRVARALEELPESAAALGAGTLCYSAVRELTRVAVPETEGDWLQAAVGKTVRQIEQMVSGRAPGDRPSDPANMTARRHVLRFEVSAETYAMWREALGEMRRRAGSHIDEDDALLLMTRQILGGPNDDGRASYQVAMTVCERCRRGQQDGRGVPLAVDDAIVEMSQCDAQNVGRVDTRVYSASSSSVATAGPDTTEAHDAETARALPSESAADPSVDPTNEDRASSRRTDAPSVASPRRGGKAAAADGGVGVVPRATQSVPPATRRLVLRRDHGRCVVDGCWAATFVDVHHLDPRAEGGGHDPTRLVTLCGAHHRAVHQGRLIIEDAPDGELRFFHADGSRYGRARIDPRAIEASTRVFFALRHLGFKETPARRAIEHAATHVGHDATVHELLRAALALLT